AGVVGLVLWRLPAANVGEDAADQRARLLFFLAAVFTTRHVALDRLDLMAGFLILASLELLNSGRRSAAGALLAGGAGYQLGPILLLPLGLQRIRSDDSAGGWRRSLLSPALYAALFAGLVLLLLAPAYAAAGDRSLAFWSYQQQRGVESSSTWAAAAGVFK